MVIFSLRSLPGQVPNNSELEMPLTRPLYNARPPLVILLRYNKDTIWRSLNERTIGGGGLSM